MNGLNYGLESKMKIKEIIEEGKLRIDSYHSLPNTRIHPTLDNSSPYHSYRFGIALAGSPKSKTDRDGPIGQKMTTISYTDADDQIVRHAEKEIGAKGKAITSKKSHEHPDTNTTSPVAKKKKNKYGV